MKKLFFLIMILPLFIVSCDDEEIPDAHFSIDIAEPEVGQEVEFRNLSSKGTYEWDFGDGIGSTLESPKHIFTGTGVFTVTLKVRNAGMEDVATMDVEIFIPTLLEIDVFEWNDQWTYDWPIADASVWLYNSLSAWDNEDETNVSGEGYTDADGVVVFSHLNEQRYYVDVWHADYNNYTLGSDDVGFIETDIVVPHKINWFVAWVDYVGTKGEMNGRRGGSYIVKRLERKVIDPESPVAVRDWKSLYAKSIKVK
jgi:PKD repeat protein